MKRHLYKSNTYEEHPMSNNVPTQSVRPPLRIPRNKTACMLLIQQLCVRGHYYWSRGVVSADRLPKLIAKFDDKFGVLDPHSRRTKKRKSGIPTAHLVLYRYPKSRQWLFWLLIAGKPHSVQELSLKTGEILFDREIQPVAWLDEYELRFGPRGTLTWWMQRTLANTVDAELRYLASAHGRPGERIDDLQRAVQRVRNRPMFSGIRRQVGQSLFKAKKRWCKTHGQKDWPAEQGPLAIMGRGFRIYDEPPAVMEAARH